MRGAVIHAPGDIRFELSADPTIETSTDAVIRMSATCVCGSDLWDYRTYGPAPRWRSWVTVPSGYSASWPPGSSVGSGSSR